MDWSFAERGWWRTICACIFLEGLVGREGGRVREIGCDARGERGEHNFDDVCSRGGNFSEIVLSHNLECFGGISCPSIS